MVEDYDMDFLVPELKNESVLRLSIGQEKAKKKCKLIESFS